MSKSARFQYFIFYKPFQVLTQFTPEGNKKCLADVISGISKDVYPVGRLDYDSEGLLLLTNDKRLNHKLLNPNFRHEREYWVQVEGEVTDAALSQLEKGVSITINKKTHNTLPAKAHGISENLKVPDRNPPIRFRKNVPDSWLSLTLCEGKNRQVRKMTAKVGFPTLRLIRVRIENIHLAAMQPGELLELQPEEVYSKLNL